MERFSSDFTWTARAMGRHCERQSVIYECDSLDFEDRSTLAGFAERIWEMGQRASTVSEMARLGRLRAHFKCVGEASGV